jgi:hypothetical protein
MKIHFAPRLFATSVVCEDNPKGKVPHCLLTWRMVKLSLDDNLSRLLLSATSTKSEIILMKNTKLRIRSIKPEYLSNVVNDG